MKRRGWQGAVVVLAVCLISGMLATAALAGPSSSSVAGYAGKPGNVLAKVQKGAPKGTAAAPLAQTTTKSGALPLTGLQLSLFVAAAVAMIGLGVGLRRLVRSQK